MTPGVMRALDIAIAALIILQVVLIVGGTVWVQIQLHGILRDMEGRKP